jgi:hypothetical protein
MHQVSPLGGEAQPAATPPGAAPQPLPTPSPSARCSCCWAKGQGIGSTLAGHGADSALSAGKPCSQAGCGCGELAPGGSARAGHAADAGEGARREAASISKVPAGHAPHEGWGSREPLTALGSILMTLPLGVPAIWALMNCDYTITGTFQLTPRVENEHIDYSPTTVIVQARVHASQLHSS